MALQPAYGAIESRTSGYMPVFGQKAPVSANPAIPTDNNTAKISPKNYEDDRTAGLSNMNENAPKDWSFFDFLDVINPLQHIPIVSSIYRSVTGDEIKPAARAMGGMLYGGPVGLISGIVNGAVAEANDGKDIPDTMMAMLTGDKPQDDMGREQIMLASKVQDTNIISAASTININNTNNTNSLLSETPKNKLPYSPLTVKGMSQSAKNMADMTALGKETLISAQQDAENPIFPPVSPTLHDALEDTNTDHAKTQKAPVFLPPELIAQEMMSALDKYTETRKNGG